MFPFFPNPLSSQQLQNHCLDCITKCFADPDARAKIVEDFRHGQRAEKATNRILTNDQTFLLIKLGLHEFINQNFISHNELEEFFASPDGIERFGEALDSADPTATHRSWLIDDEIDDE